MIRLIPGIISTQEKIIGIIGNKDFPAGFEASFTYFPVKRKEAGLICIHFLILFCGFSTTFSCRLLYRMKKYFSASSIVILKWDVLLSSTSPASRRLRFISSGQKETERLPLFSSAANNGFSGTNLHRLRVCDSF